MINIKELIERQKRKKSLEGNIAAEIHHLLMSKYGWIPFEEFKKLPIPVVFDLLEEIRKENEEYEKAMKKIRRK